MEIPSTPNNKPNIPNYDMDIKTPKISDPIETDNCEPNCTPNIPNYDRVVQTPTPTPNIPNYDKNIQ